MPHMSNCTQSCEGDSRAAVLGLCLVLLVSVTNCGGSVTGDSVTRDPSAGGTSAPTGTGGTASGGTAKGTVAATGGGITGGLAVGGQTASGTNPCTSPTATPISIGSGCYSDQSCGSGQFCDLQNCTSPCGCQNGAWTCINSCVAQCKPATCTQASQEVASLVGGKRCELIVRVNAEATTLLSMRAVCGSGQPITLEQAEAQLLAISRINWSTATTYGTATSGYLFVHESNPYDVMAFGPLTGQSLFEFTTSGQTDTVFGDWSSAPALDGDCKGQAPPYQTLGPWSAQDPGDAISKLLYQKGVLNEITRANAGYDGIILVRAQLSKVEYFAIIPTWPRIQ